MMFQINTLPKTFLAANSAKGFVSYFKECYSADDGWKTYIIKGGPGTGKSSIMKSLAAYFAEKGERVELCHCSSDPDSLDAVIFFDRKAVIMDGTAPHTVDPTFPGVCETIINLSDCWDEEKLDNASQEIIKLTRENKAYHLRASRYIAAAGALLSDINRMALQFVDAERASTYAKKLANRLIPEGDGYKEHIRFLGGVTPKGLLFFKNTPQKMAKTIIAVDDEYGAVRDIIFSVIESVAKAKKQEIIICYNAVNPDKIDHIMFPKLSLAFCSQNRHTHPEGITRCIHSRRFINAADKALYKSKIGFAKRAADELLMEAVRIIAEAKHTHDLLENYYINAMDFSLVGRHIEKLAEKIERR